VANVTFGDKIDPTSVMFGQSLRLREAEIARYSTRYRVISQYYPKKDLLTDSVNQAVA
jgi:hypothetical protein